MEDWTANCLYVDLHGVMLSASFPSPTGSLCVVRIEACSTCSFIWRSNHLMNPHSGDPSCQSLGYGALLGFCPLVNMVSKSQSHPVKS